MADTKISALPVIAAGNELDTDQFACVQAATTQMQTRAQIVSTVATGLAADIANLAAHVGTTTTPIHGSSAAAGANTLAHRNAAGDLAATDFNAVAGTAANPSHTFTVDPDTGLYRFAANELGIATVGAHRAHWNTTGAIILNNAAASTFMTGPGVTIQQGAYDDEAVALKSTDVAHGMTAEVDTDTYHRIRKAEAVAGGVALDGFKDADGVAGGAAQLRGYLGKNADTTKTTAGRAIVEVEGYIKSGAGIGNTNADGNVFGVRTRRGGAAVTLLIVDEDADLYNFGEIRAEHQTAKAAGVLIEPIRATTNDAANKLEIILGLSTNAVAASRMGFLHVAEQGVAFRDFAIQPYGSHVIIGGFGPPAASALLELSSTTGSLLLPRMTTAERNALAAVNGMVVYDATVGAVYAREAGAWVNL